MVKADLNYDEFEELGKVFDDMNATLLTEVRTCAKRIGNELKANTESAIPREPKPRHGVHLADDVKMSTSVNENGAKITVKGGSKTGKLWWPIDMGHFTPGNKWVEGKRFTDKAYQSTDVEGAVEDMIHKVVQSNE